MALVPLDRVFNNVLTVGLLLGFGLIMYNKIKNQTTKETIEQLKNLFGGENNG